MNTSDKKVFCPKCNDTGRVVAYKRCDGRGIHTEYTTCWDCHDQRQARLKAEQKPRPTSSPDT